MASEEIRFVYICNRAPSEVVLAGSNMMMFLFQNCIVIHLTIIDHLCFLDAVLAAGDTKQGTLSLHW